MDTAFNSLMAMRRAGKRPVGPILVTDDYATARRGAKLGLSVLMVKTGYPYDWRIVRALAVIVSTRAKRDTAAPTVKAIFDQDPRSLLWVNRGQAEVETEWVIPCQP